MICLLKRSFKPPRNKHSWGRRVFGRRRPLADHLHPLCELFVTSEKGVASGRIGTDFCLSRHTVPPNSSHEKVSPHRFLAGPSFTICHGANHFNRDELPPKFQLAGQRIAYWLDDAGDESAEGEYASGEGENFQRADQAERVECFHGETEEREKCGECEGSHGEVEGAQGADEQLGSLCRGAHFLEVALANARLGLRPDFECEWTED